MKLQKRLIALVTIMVLFPFFSAMGGPYTEQGIPAYIEPNGLPSCPGEPNVILNPIFHGWATKVVSYVPTPEVEERDPCWFDPNMALGPCWSHTTLEDVIFDIVSLGDLREEQIEANVPPGQITLSFGAPIYNGEGYDFAVFENGYWDIWNGLDWCELGYVEVSSNELDFARFPSVSLVPYDTGGISIPYYRCIDHTDIYNLAGKHPWFTGTPFDLGELVNNPLVLSGNVDLNNINVVRIVDVPGSGDFFDEATHYGYPINHPIYDPWPTFDSEGFDLDAIGVLHLHQYPGDFNYDGAVNFADFAILASAWQKHFGQDGWISRCDISIPKDLVVDFLDFAAFADGWLKVEQWRGN